MTLLVLLTSKTPTTVTRSFGVSYRLRRVKEPLPSAAKLMLGATSMVILTPLPTPPAPNKRTVMLAVNIPGEYDASAAVAAFCKVTNRGAKVSPS